MNSTTGIRSNTVFDILYAEGREIERTCQAMAILLVGGFGEFGNIFILILSLKYTVRKNLHHLIINMATADTIILLFNSSISMLEILRENKKSNIPFVWANILCKSLAYIKEVCLTLSMVTLLVISIERFKATTMTVQRTQPYTLKQRLATISLAWLVSIGTPLYTCFYIAPTNFYQDFFSCRYDLKNGQVAIILSMLTNTLYFLLFILILLITFFTLRRVSKPNAISESIPEAQRQARKLRIRKVVQMVLYSLLSYMVCYSPSLVFKIWTEKSWQRLSTGYYSSRVVLIWWQLLFVVYYFFPILNSFLSPLICVCFLSDFRGAAKKILYGPYSAAITHQ